MVDTDAHEPTYWVWEENEAEQDGWAPVASFYEEDAAEEYAERFYSRLGPGDFGESRIFCVRTDGGPVTKWTVELGYRPTFSAMKMPHA